MWGFCTALNVKVYGIALHDSCIFKTRASVNKWLIEQTQLLTDLSRTNACLLQCLQNHTQKRQLENLA